MPKHLGKLIVPVTSTPAVSPTVGEVYYDTVQKKLRCYGGPSPTWLDTNSSRPPGFIETTATDLSTSSTSFVDLLTLGIGTSGGDLLIQGFGSASHSSTSVRVSEFILTLNGIQQAASGITSASNTGAYCFSMCVVVPIAAGSHTIALRWRTTGTGSVRIRGATAATREYASLLIQEIL